MSHPPEPSSCPIRRLFAGAPHTEAPTWMDAAPLLAVLGLWLFMQIWMLAPTFMR